jgi:hypothetical protein
MDARALLSTDSMRIVDCRCTASPGDAPFVEVHQAFAMAYVRKGSFGYRFRGQTHELVAGSILVGRPGDEYVCTHEHHAGGDECLSFHPTDEFVHGLGHAEGAFRTGAVPPLSELMVLGELAQAAAEGESDVSLDEVSLSFVARFVDVMTGRARKPVEARAADRRRAVEAALFLDTHSAEALSLERTALEAGLSPFHFLRLSSPRWSA